MILARVDGNIVTTHCHPSLVGFRNVICQPIDGQGGDEGGPILAIDCLGAGLHQHVLITTDGSHTRATVKDEHSPLRNMIIGIVDDSGPSPIASRPLPA